MLECAVTRANLTPGMLACAGEGAVHSVFRRVVNATFSGRMLTLAEDALPDMPDALYLPAAAMQELLKAKEGDRAVLRARELILNAQRFRFSFGTSARHRPPQLGGEYLRVLLSACRSVEKPSGIERLPSAWRARIDASLRGYIHSRCRGGDGWDDLRAVLGLGVGATPSADDAFLAAGAVLPGAFSCPEEMMRRTTDVSAKYLRCACEGYYAAPLLELLAEPSAAHARALAACGSTSGRDMLYGLRAVCETLLERKEGAAL